MSLSFSDRVKVFLGPRRVHVARRSRALRARTDLELSVSCAVPASESDWRPAVETLARVAASGGWRRADVFITLSNHFVRYALVPAVRGLKRAERDAAAAHHFAGVYGDSVAGWRLALADGSKASNVLAAAVDPELLSAIGDGLAAAGVKARSIEPFLVAGYNACRRTMNGSRAWLAVTEPGRACVAQLDGGQWVALRSQRLSAPVRVALPAMLEQVRLAAEPDAAPGPVYLVSREPSSLEFPADSAWSVEAVAA